ncbi:uncharacterized protein BDZ99DRAFT_273863 [Mytilinidion resinicola]|uniref:Uncharacterized protein n=1 Tax=Mytilinidion resinicola TaxID=574789 RepID=A0A6A6YTP2_9PEZI|nr:uncharacterized protein BDZ99DRAFT_273863 [Mytilinidion resinicola]KAF2811335.1 hypothetical protein BDZ99DRAFT_273863 [Mytilinidion resinicola]
MSEGPSQIILLFVGIDATRPKTHNAGLTVICQEKCQCSNSEDGVSSCSGSCRYLVATYKAKNEISICSLESPHVRLPVPRAYAIDPDPLSASSIDRAMSWLQTCLEHHNECRQNPTERQEPTIGEDQMNLVLASSTSLPRFRFTSPIRLLQIEEFGNVTTARLTILEDKTVDYVALSHRWNSGPMPDWVTKKENLQKRFQSFELTNFSKTTLDAAIISKRLGFEYV